MSKLPNPGSEEAVQAGCTCPVLDNNYGESPPWPPNGWWYNGECPVHCPEETKEEAQKIAKEIINQS